VQSIRNFCRIATPAIFLICARASSAQDNTLTFSCSNFGIVQAREPLGDKEGHAFSVGEYSCRAESEPLAGGVWTETIVWEWDKTDASLVEAAGVIRTLGGAAVVKITEGSFSLTIAEGRVTGFAGSGRGVFPLAVGVAALLAGKPFTYTVKSTIPPAQFSLEMKLD
jgi:hypothetical protein